MALYGDYDVEGDQLSIMSEYERANDLDDDENEDQIVYSSPNELSGLSDINLDKSSLRKWFIFGGIMALAGFLLFSSD